MSAASPRGTICAERSTVLSHDAFPGNQHILRVSAPAAAGRAEPGSFAHLQCDQSVPLRRPLSIMRANPRDGWLEFLYKPVGHGLAALTRKQPGDHVHLLAPIGNGFVPPASKRRILAIGGGVGIPPMIFLAEKLKDDSLYEPLVLMGSELPFPFEQIASAQPVPGVSEAATDGLAILEGWGVASRLASNAGLPGAFRGHVPELARTVLEYSSQGQLEQTHVFACGPKPMLAATAKLAREFGVGCELALEEYMACGVGGCAGCTVPVTTREGRAMKRVCVDGPVFRAEEIYPS